jgi:hypothetical protein
MLGKDICEKKMALICQITGKKEKEKKSVKITRFQV